MWHLSIPWLHHWPSQFHQEPQFYLRRLETDRPLHVRPPRNNQGYEWTLLDYQCWHMLYITAFIQRFHQELYYSIAPSTSFNYQLVWLLNLHELISVPEPMNWFKTLAKKPTRSIVVSSNFLYKYFDNPAIPLYKQGLQYTKPSNILKEKKIQRGRGRITISHTTNAILFRMHSLCQPYYKYINMFNNTSRVLTCYIKN